MTPDLTGVAQRALEDPEAFKEEVEQQIDQLGEAGKAIKKGDPQRCSRVCWAGRARARRRPGRKL